LRLESARIGSARPIGRSSMDEFVQSPPCALNPPELGVLDRLEGRRWVYFVS